METPPIACPKCGSTQIIANKKGFSGKKAVVGGLLTGGIGLLAGTIGSNKVVITCLNCGNQFQPGAKPEPPPKSEATIIPKEETRDSSVLIIIGIVIVAVIIFVAVAANSNSSKSGSNIAVAEAVDSDDLYYRKATSLVDSADMYMQLGESKKMTVKRVNRYINPLMHRIDSINDLLRPALQLKLKQYRIAKINQAVDKKLAQESAE